MQKDFRVKTRVKSKDDTVHATLNEPVRAYCAGCWEEVSVW